MAGEVFLLRADIKSQDVDFPSFIFRGKFNARNQLYLIEGRSLCRFGNAFCRVVVCEGESSQTFFGSVSGQFCR